MRSAADKSAQRGARVATEPSAAPTWFVDEAGDPVLFARGGRVVVGVPGTSRFFLLGKLEVEDGAALASDLIALRAELLADPYFRDVPSMQPARGKTAVFFHAKDDPAEVRYRVFKVLLNHELRFSAVVRDKVALLSYVQQRRRIDPAYSYSANGNELYDEMTRLLFGQFRHVSAEPRVVFARRGAKPRTEALRRALVAADAEFEASFGLPRRAIEHVNDAFAREHAGLQAADYFLWALQRFYERGEERFVKLVWPKVVQVHDIDAPRTKRSTGAVGVFFNEERPLVLANRAGVGNEASEDIG